MTTEAITASICFFVPGDPKGQPRPRAFSRNGMARVYDPGTAEGWKSAVAVALRQTIGVCDFGSHPVAVGLDFCFRRPKKHYRTGRHAHELCPDAPLEHTGKPDIDNLAKALTDALTALNVWRDDAQIARLECSKTYRDNPGCHVRIRRILGETQENTSYWS